MKIAHVITRMVLGGAQENTLFTVQGLSQMNHEVTLITGPSLGPEGQLQDYLHDSEFLFKTILIPSLKRNVSPLLDLIALFKLYLLFKKEKYEIVHTHSSKAGIIGRLAAKLAGVKLIIHTIHGPPFYEYQSKWINAIYIFCEKMMAKCCSKLICVAFAMQNEFLKYGIGKREQYLLVRSGVELDKFHYDEQKRKELREKYNLNENHIVIGTIARLFELKGHDHIINIAHSLVKKHQNIKFVFIGDGVLKNELLHKIKKNNLDQYFSFIGLLAPDEVCSIYSMLDIVIHPSLREGLARVLPEALAAERAVVTFDIGGASEVIGNNETGFIVPAGDEEELSKQLELFLDNPDLRNKMGQQGKKRVYPEFLKEEMVKKINQLYIEVFKQT